MVAPSENSRSDHLPPEREVARENHPRYPSPTRRSPATERESRYRSPHLNVLPEVLRQYVEEVSGSFGCDPTKWPL